MRFDQFAFRSAERAFTSHRHALIVQMTLTKDAFLPCDLEQMEVSKVRRIYRRTARRLKADFIREPLRHR